MSEIKDKVKQELVEALVFELKLVSPMAENELRHNAEQIVEKMANHPNWAIVDRDAELPTSTGSSWDLQFKWGFEGAIQAVKKADYVKEIKD